jgi:multidrug resistance protein MdtO
MAPRATERARRAIRDLLFLLEPRPGRVPFALRLALICALTTAVAEIYQTPEAALTIYLAFFINQKDRATSVILDIAILVLFTLLEALVLLIAIVVLDSPMWRVIAMTGFSLGMLLVIPASKLKAMNGPLALIVGYALDELGLVPVGDLATRALLYLWLVVGIPAGISLLVNLVLALPPRRTAERAIAYALRLSAQMLRRPDAHVRRRFAEALRDMSVSVPGWLRLAGVEHTVPAADLMALKRAAESTPMLMAAVDVIDRHGAPAIPREVLDSAARTLEEMAAIFENGGYPVDLDFHANAVISTGSVAARALKEIESAINGFTTPLAVTAPAPAEQGGGFIDPAQLSNPDSLRYALKTTAAAMSCYLLYTLLDWPGIHTCFLTCYIVSLGTAAETIEKLGLRIIGCLIGAAAGLAAIVWLLPQLTSIGGLMIAVLLFAAASAYVAGGSPRIGYAGFQMAFAFLLCLVQGDAPAFALSIARDRIIGILIGNFVSYVVFTQIWPVSVAQRIDPAIAKLLQGLRAVASGSAAARPTALRNALAQIATVEADLHLARYEPASMGASAGWLAVRRRAVRALASLLGPMSLMDRSDAAATHINARLDAATAQLSGAAQPSPTLPPPPHDRFAGAIDRSLRKLESAIARTSGGTSHAI